MRLSKIRTRSSRTSTIFDAKCMAQNKAKAFAHLDEGKLGWFHIKTVMIAGAGFFSDAYDIFVISQALPMIYQVYFGQPQIVKTPQNVKVDFVDNYPNGVHFDAWLKASTNWGNLIGQITFGIAGDSHGRKAVYGLELMVIIVCTIGSILTGNMVHGANILQVLSFWRFILGIGIGGDYPMSAVITSEFANVRYRGMMLAAVFAMQGIGILIGSAVYVATLTAMKETIQNDYTALDVVWRVAIGFGIVPALLVIYFRFTMPETPRYTADVVGDAEIAARDVELALQGKAVIGNNNALKKNKVNKVSDFGTYFSKWKNMKILIGTAYTWFALDVAWYGLSLNQSTVLNLINFNDIFYQTAVGNIIIACAGTVPGYWFTVFLIEKLGRKPIQYMGFAVITICLIILAATWDTISTHQTAFMAVFTIAQFFFQFGPNTTTFVIPGEVFPTRFKATCHGISAAAGKAGAILGVQAVGPYFNSNTVTVLSTFAVVMATGGLATILLPETAGKTLEELNGDGEE
ncbi:MFS general substrate transporter [Rhizoclosmatium globosum]|uniref:MFS general substrate transporter n=1 Tax=Rhizoclosmatium globosum TaxID=329046 RepID=A0A1Y2CIJ8_9FUNG|nr:MFS general substrate transporter [Rhizoclosmatium globosum]|eukprot:ORY46871.1 MFS general substrate transporter [Rhizoclosmatium globosum]